MPSTPPLTDSIAATVRAARTERGLSVAELGVRAGVSKAMVSKVERGDAQPTAALLARLSGALSLSLSELVARAENADARVARRAEQPTWTDPATGYVRRAVTPAGGPLELVEVALPAGAQAAFPAESYAFAHHHVLVLAGRLRFLEGELVHELAAGDCLRLGAPAPCVYVNPTTEECRYLVALTRR